MTRERKRSRRGSDWIGFVFYGVAAGTTLMMMPAFGILLMPTLALELFAAVAFLIREPARATERTGRARLSAYGGTLFLLVFLLVADAFYPYWMKPTGWAAGRMAGIILWMAGSAWAYSVWYLRYAFSIEPEARRLVTGGPYETARHPVYLGYFAQYSGDGAVVSYFSVWLGTAHVVLVDGGCPPSVSHAPYDELVTWFYVRVGERACWKFHNRKCPQRSGHSPGGHRRPRLEHAAIPAYERDVDREPHEERVNGIRGRNDQRRAFRH